MMLVDRSQLRKSQEFGFGRNLPRICPGFAPDLPRDLLGYDLLINQLFAILLAINLVTYNLITNATALTIYKERALTLMEGQVQGGEGRGGEGKGGAIDKTR